MEMKQMKPDALSLTNPDFAKYADICGGKGFPVYESASLEPILRSALACDQPAIVDVHTSAPLFPGLKAKEERSGS
jgi:thiamine pyrophosphate-dependent acetolactate synthase large subunit-like protein